MTTTVEELAHRMETLESRLSFTFNRRLYTLEGALESLKTQLSGLGDDVKYLKALPSQWEKLLQGRAKDEGPGLANMLCDVDTRVKSLSDQFGILSTRLDAVGLRLADVEYDGTKPSHVYEEEAELAAAMAITAADEAVHSMDLDDA